MEDKSLLDRVILATSNVFHVPPQEVRGKSRSRIVSDARQMAMYVAREKGEYLSRIADYFGITPQAVSIATNRVEDRIKAHRSMKERYDRIGFVFMNID